MTRLPSVRNKKICEVEIDERTVITADASGAPPGGAPGVPAGLVVRCGGDVAECVIESLENVHQGVP
jgi:hypothetical protein